MSVFESRTGIDQQKTSPNSPVTVPKKVNSSTPGMQHLVENNVQLHRLNDLQQLSNTSARVMQLKALAKMADESPLIQLRSNGQVIQLASRVDWTSQQFQYNDAAGDLQTEEVGRTMTAHLEPDHPIKGADADSTSSPDLYNALKRHWEPGSKSWVRGHVLNHDLGGPNTTPNLFPITGHANGDHSNYVGTGRDIRNAGGTFDCVASWNEEEDDLKTISRTITSTPSLKAAFGNGAGARAGRSFSGVGYAEADTIAERDEEGDVTGGGDVPGYEIPDTWAHGNLDADGRTQWMTDHRVGASATNYRQNSVAVVDEEGANVEMGGV